VQILQFPSQFIYANNAERGKCSAFFLMQLASGDVCVCVSTWPSSIISHLREWWVQPQRSPPHDCAAADNCARSDRTLGVCTNWIHSAELSIWEGEPRTQFCGGALLCSFAFCSNFTLIEFCAEKFFCRPPSLRCYKREMRSLLCGLHFSWRALEEHIYCDCPNQSALTVVIETARRRPHTIHWQLFIELCWFMFHQLRQTKIINFELHFF